VRATALAGGMARVGEVCCSPGMARGDVEGDLLVACPELMVPTSMGSCCRRLPATTSPSSFRPPRSQPAAASHLNDMLPLGEVSLQLNLFFHKNHVFIPIEFASEECMLVSL
jgi:hypothetical protein